ncbi:MAG: glycerophosphodiester phosphodiesterase family protein [Pseudomonadota bacterium]
MPLFVVVTASLFCFGTSASAGDVQTAPTTHYAHTTYDENGREIKRPALSYGDRPAYLIDGMSQSPLKRTLQRCANQRPRRTDFAIGHRGAPLQFPEHTEESYRAAARQGAGILECDVSFTRDAELVCRHSQCDLHTTTNILETPLAALCSEPFQPAVYDAAGGLITPASAKCCTSDLTVDQFKSLTGKMDAANPRATTDSEYLDGTPSWRTDLYTGRGTLLTHKESIELFRALDAKFTPELKGVDTAIGFADSGLTQETYAQRLIDDYREAGVSPRRVWAQSFNLDDVLYWINNTPDFGQQAVFLDSRYAGPTPIDPVNGDPKTFSPTMEEFAAMGVNIIAPPMYFLLRTTDKGRIVPSPYARAAKRAGLDIIAWTFERSDLTDGSRDGSLGADGLPNATFYYRFDRNPAAQSINSDSDMYKALDVLAKRVGIIGIFSDWPATVTYYANCMGLR